MAACPCGCGRNLSFMKKRLATHARDLMVVFPILEQASDRDPSAAQLLRSGRSLSSQILGAAHGESASGRVPSLSEVNAWRTSASGAVRAAAKADPTFVSNYVAGLASADRHLVQSLL